jgi:hypothetical protein
LVGGIKRLFVLVWPNGMLSGTDSWPAAGDDPSGWTLAPFQQSLAPHQGDLLLLNGLDYLFIRDSPGSGDRTGHACFPGMLTGALYQTLSASTDADVAGGPSIDQYIGGQLRAAGYPGLTSLNLGVFVQGTARLSWKGAGVPVLPDTDPTHVFSTYFQGAIPPQNVDSGAPPAIPVAGAGTVPLKRRFIQQSILDNVVADINRLNNVVGTADRLRIDAHLTTVRQLEAQINRTGSIAPAVDAGVSQAAGAGCTPPNLAGVTLSTVSAANVPALTLMQMQLAVAAFASDLTRVVVLQISDQNAANLIMPWVNSAAGVPFSAGGPSPGDPNTGDVNSFRAIAVRDSQDKVNCDTWFQSQMAQIVGLMKGVTDPTGQSMLDTSAIVAMNNMRTGAGETTGVPVVVAGSCGGYFKTGRSLTLPAGTPNNGLLVALCNAMGTPVTTFGNPAYGGELTVLKG